MTCAMPKGYESNVLTVAQNQMDEFETKDKSKL